MHRTLNVTRCGRLQCVAADTIVVTVYSGGRERLTCCHRDEGRRVTERQSARGLLSWARTDEGMLLGRRGGSGGGGRGRWVRDAPGRRGAATDERGVVVKGRYAEKGAAQSGCKGGRLQFHYKL